MRFTIVLYIVHIHEEVMSIKKYILTTILVTLIGLGPIQGASSEL